MIRPKSQPNRAVAASSPTTYFSLLQSKEHSLSATKRKYAISKSIRLPEMACVLLSGQFMRPIGLMPEVMLSESSVS
ncbi:Uncharacterised protein [Vibrio cholerae]|nr:Uncharacterised protein [Vibrio cholerae]CSB71551.1 Uncharacterised protein [Vibrio cholerae]